MSLGTILVALIVFCLFSGVAYAAWIYLPFAAPFAWVKGVMAFIIVLIGLFITLRILGVVGGRIIVINDVKNGVLVSRRYVKEGKHV